MVRTFEGDSDKKFRDFSDVKNNFTKGRSGISEGTQMNRNQVAKSHMIN